MGEGFGNLRPSDLLLGKNFEKPQHDYSASVDSGQGWVRLGRVALVRLGWVEFGCIVLRWEKLDWLVLG